MGRPQRSPGAAPTRQPGPMRVATPYSLAPSSAIAVPFRIRGSNGPCLAALHGGTARRRADARAYGAGRCTVALVHQRRLCYGRGVGGGTLVAPRGCQRLLRAEQEVLCAARHRPLRKGERGDGGLRPHAGARPNVNLTPDPRTNPNPTLTLNPTPTFDYHAQELIAHVINSAKDNQWRAHYAATARVPPRARGGLVSRKRVRNLHSGVAPCFVHVPGVHESQRHEMMFRAEARAAPNPSPTPNPNPNPNLQP
eukprot:scaffold10103_cov59-Phaeocystis_antarctica.AAC.3